MKLTNTWKHLLVGTIAGLLWFLICLIPGMRQLEIFGLISFFFITIAWEQAQRLRAKKWNWLDSVADVIAGNAGFFLGHNVMLRLFAGNWIV